MPSAASKAANARYMTELQRGANHTFAPELPEPPAHFQPPTLAGLLPLRRRGLPGARAQSCEACRMGKRACDRTETCSSCRVRDVRCEYIAAAPLRATIAGSAQHALNRVEITRMRAQVALLLRVLRITDAELQYLMRRADEPAPFVLPSPRTPVRWAVPVRRTSVLDQHDDELPLPPVVEQREPPADEDTAEEPTAAEQEHVEPDRAPSEPAAPSPSPPAEAMEQPTPEPAQVEEREQEPALAPPTPERKREREPEPEPAHEPSRRRSQRFMVKPEEPQAQTPKPKKAKAKATTPRRRSTRLQGGAV